MSAGRIFLLALAVRLAALAALHGLSLAAGQGGFSLWAGDDRYYHAAAAAGAGWLRQGDWDRWARELPLAYPRWLAVVYALTGPSLLAGQLLNALAGAATAALVAATARRATGDARVAAVAGGLVAVYPSHVYHSVQLLKDAWTTLAGVAAVWAFLAWRESGRPRHLAACLAAYAVLMELRVYAGIALELAGVLALLPAALAGTRPGGRRALALWVAGTGLASLLAGHPPWGAEALGMDLVRIRREVYGTGGAALGLDLGTGPLSARSAAWLVSLTYLLLGPFPWQAVRGPQWALGALDAAFGWLLVGAAAAAWMRDLRRRAVTEEALLTAGFTGAMLAAIATFSDNVGANVRLRLLPYALLAIPAARALAAWPPARRWLDRAGPRAPVAEEAAACTSAR